MLIAVVSGKGSPGTSTTALALTLAWPSAVLLADCDPRGGDLLWGYGQGKHNPGTGLASVQLNTRRAASSAEALWPATVSLGENRWALPGVDESLHAQSVDWMGLAKMLRTVPAGVDVIVDCGVVPAHAAPQAVWSAADLVILVTRSSLKSTRAALNAGALVRKDLMSAGLGADRLMSVIVGPGKPYSLAEVTAALAEVAPVVGELPWEPRAAATLSDGVIARKRDLARLTAAATTTAHSVRERGLSLSGGERFAPQARNGSANGMLRSAT